MARLRRQGPAREARRRGTSSPSGVAASSVRSAAADRIRRHLGKVEAVDERGDVEAGASGDDGPRSGSVEPLEAPPRCRQPVGDGERSPRDHRGRGDGSERRAVRAGLGAHVPTRSPRRTWRELALSISAGARRLRGGHGERRLARSRSGRRSPAAGGSSRGPPEGATKHCVVEDEHRRAPVRAGGAPGRRDQLDRGGAAARPTSRRSPKRTAEWHATSAARRWRRSSLPASRFVEAFDELADERSGSAPAAVTGTAVQRTVAGAERLDAETASREKVMFVCNS